MDVVASGIISSRSQLETGQCHQNCRENFATHLVVIANEFIAMELEGFFAELWDEPAKGKV
jgi:hypothetical protein